MSDDDEKALMSVCDQFWEIEERLARDLLQLDFMTKTSIEYIYNPLDYAKETHQSFIMTYNNQSPKKILFLGMNPGPFGMAQTGVPFGQVSLTRDFLKIDGAVNKPDKEHPKRQIEGFDCKRSEVSGERFWSFIKEVCQTPQNFAKNCMVYNHCPLVFMSKSGKNVTPPEIELKLRNQMFHLCDAALSQVIQLFQCEIVIGLGRFAENRAKKIVKEFQLQNVEVKFLVHPSPASPAANSGWSSLALKTLNEYNITNLLRPN